MHCRYGVTHDWSKEEYGIVGGTGPVMLWETLKQYEAMYPNSPDITILPTEAIYPVDWVRSGTAGGDPVYLDEEGVPHCVVTGSATEVAVAACPHMHLQDLASTRFGTAQCWQEQSWNLHLQSTH